MIFFIINFFGQPGRRSPNIRQAPSWLSEGNERLPDCPEGDKRTFVEYSASAFVGFRQKHCRFVVRLPDCPEGARFDRTTRKALAEYSASTFLVV